MKLMSEPEYRNKGRPAGFWGAHGERELIKGVWGRALSGLLRLIASPYTPILYHCIPPQMRGRRSKKFRVIMPHSAFQATM